MNDLLDPPTPVLPILHAVERFSPRPVLYVAGPYTNPDPVINTNAACRAATVIYKAGKWAPLVPHITLMWHAITPQPVEFWYDLDLSHIARCSAIVRLPGASSGADREMAFAHLWAIPRINFTDLPQEAQDIWLASR